MGDDDRRLVPLADEHAEALRAIRREPEVERFWDELEDEFPFEEDVERWTILVDGEVAGMVQAWHEREPKYRHAGIDIFLGRAFHGRGIGSWAVREIRLLLQEQRGVHRIVIDPAAHNLAAVGAYRAAGFREVGVLRHAERAADGSSWHDALLMEHVRGIDP